MKELFKNNQFYPQNFFITTDESTDIDSILKVISDKAALLSPECFDAEENFFIFKLRYQPPYVKVSEFREIKDLQIEAISRTRFKNEYNGYIGIDISEWIEHTDEDHFLNSVLALKEMSSHWKYLFFANNELGEASIAKAISTIKHKIWLHELNSQDFNKTNISDKLANKLKNNHNIKLALGSQKIIKDIWNETSSVNEDNISDIANDISQYLGNIKCLSESSFIEYLSDKGTYTHFLMSEKEQTKLNDLIKEREEKR